ncbi:MAG: hypothetical protein R2789_19330 [Microthrixaceae bacterium]
MGPVLYLYTTNTVDQNVPVLKSAAGFVGVPTGDALPETPRLDRARSRVGTLGAADG